MELLKMLQTLCIIGILIRGVVAVKITLFQVPAEVKVGQPAIINCKYELMKNETVWKINFYKDYSQFYCYYPEGMPKIFDQNKKNVTLEPVAGVNVNLKLSSGSLVHLSNVTKETSGQYHCEIKTATFESAYADKQMNVTGVGAVAC